MRLSERDVPVPPAVRVAAGGRDLELVWTNISGGLTFLADARRRAAAGTMDPAAEWHECHRDLIIAGALDLATVPPQPDRLVVCHGDACAPNTLIGADGRWTGHVDLGCLGVADRWAGPRDRAGLHSLHGQVL